MWVRYVDDTFVIWPHGEAELESFHNHINNQHSNIKFTKEVERKSSIPFLDVLVNRKGPRLLTTVYHKPTHTNRYINYNSNHYPRVLRSTLLCLKDRANKICKQKVQSRGDIATPRNFPGKRLPKVTHQTTPLSESQGDSNNIK